jgi:hypothetical protein
MARFISPMTHWFFHTEISTVAGLRRQKYQSVNFVPDKMHYLDKDYTEAPCGRLKKTARATRNVVLGLAVDLEDMALTA